MILHFFNAAEGGQSMKDVLASLKYAGIPARRAHSPYVGHNAVEVLTNNKRTMRRAERIVFGG